MRRYGIIWITLSFKSLAFAQAVVPISVQDAVAIAVANNTDVAVASDRVRLAEFRLRESRGNFLPRLTLTGNYMRNIDRPVIFLPESFGLGGATKIGADNNVNAYVDLSVPIYSRYNVSNRNYAQSDYYLQREILRQTRQTITASVKKAYFACLLAKETVNVRKRALMTAEANHAYIVQKLAQGVATEYDETSARVRMSVFRNDLLDAVDRQLLADNTLKVLLSLPPESILLPGDSLYLDDRELALVPRGRELADNSALRQKEQLEDLAHWQTKIARSSFYPVLSGTGTYQYQSQQNDFRLSQYQWVLTSAVGLRLTVPLFNGMITRNRVQQAEISEGIARIERNYTCMYNASRLNELQSRLHYLKARIAMQEDNSLLAARAVELVKERYRYGKASLLEVNSAEVDYVSARLSYLQSITDYKTNYCDLQLLIGDENP